MVFGTDAPPLTAIKGDGIQMVRDLKLAPADEAKVFSGNAKKLLKTEREMAQAAPAKAVRPLASLQHPRCCGIALRKLPQARAIAGPAL